MEVKSLMNRVASLPVNKGGKEAGGGPFSFKVGFGTPVAEAPSQKDGVFANKSVAAKDNQSSLRAGFEKMNDLSALLSPKHDQGLTHDLSLATLHKQKILQVKETWIQKVKRGANYAASPDKIADMRRQAKGLQATGGDYPPGVGSVSMMTKDTSALSLAAQFQSHKTLARGTSPSLQGSSRALMPIPEDYGSQTINPVRAMQSLFAMTGSDTQGNFLPEIRTARRQSVPRQVVSGKGLDDLYTKRNTQLLKLQDENKNYITENNQLKVVNEKLIDRLELYTSIIEKEASANTYYYNYPPKADNTLVDDKNKKKTSGADGEGQKVKKMYEDMLEQQRKSYEATIKDLKKNTSEEIESLTTMFGSTSHELVLITIEHRALQQKFNLYYQKSDEYIKDREAKIVEMENEVKRLHDEYSSFDERFSSAKNEATQLRKQLQALEQEHSELKRLSQRQSKEIADYEDRYKGIDIGRMHEEIESIKTKLHAAQVGEKSVLNDLFTLRDRMLKLASTYDKNKEGELKKMRDHPKTYSGAASAFADPEKGPELRAREAKARELQTWKGDQSVEDICAMFTAFLTTPTAISALKLEAVTPPNPQPAGEAGQEQEGADGEGAGDTVPEDVAGEAAEDQVEDGGDAAN